MAKVRSDRQQEDNIIPNEKEKLTLMNVVGIYNTQGSVHVKMYRAPKLLLFTDER